MRALTLAILSLCLTSPALAHGDADWIMHEPSFVSEYGTHCCGPKDCQRMPQDVIARLVKTPNGYTLDGVSFTYGNKGMYTSIDSDWWYCAWGEGPKCLFEPSLGS